MIVGQRSANTVKAVNYGLDNCNRDYESEASRRRNCSRFDCIHIFEHGLKHPTSFDIALTTIKTAVKLLRETGVNSLLERVTIENPYVSYQDSARCHNCGKSKKWFRKISTNLSTPILSLLILTFILHGLLPHILIQLWCTLAKDSNCSD